jgi:hypothetical protein
MGNQRLGHLEGDVILGFFLSVLIAFAPRYRLLYLVVCFGYKKYPLAAA